MLERVKDEVNQKLENYHNRKLIKAIIDGDLKNVKYHIKKGANLNIVKTKYNELVSPIFLASGNNQYEIAQFLLRKGADVNKVCIMK